MYIQILLCINILIYKVNLYDEDKTTNKLVILIKHSMSYDNSESLVVSPLPGQLAGLQYCFSTDSPTHGAPPYRGSTHVLFLNFSPSPHDKEHSPQADHSDQYPSTTKLKHILFDINQRICGALFCLFSLLLVYCLNSAYFKCIVIIWTVMWLLVNA